MKDWQYDLYRCTGKTDRKTCVKAFLNKREFRLLVYYRQYRKSSGLKKGLIKLLNHRLGRKISIELPYSVQLGRGALFLHPYGIVINRDAVIGRNLTILKGATVGNSMTGKPGSPVIGDNVYIGLNSSVVGGIRIGNDVMIAANTFVNFDVPDGSLVIGSPGVIHPREKASQPYILRSIDQLEEQIQEERL